VLDAPPKESETRSWCYVAVGVLAIYCTIPVARPLREVVGEQIGLEFFLYFTIALTVAAGVLAFLNLRKRKLPVNAYVWLFGIVAAFIAYIYHLREIPEEAIHVVEYGVIGILIYRALVHRVRDFTIYLIATWVVGMVGVVDEYIQWVAPSRYFDLRDIAINFLAGGMSQLAIAAGLRPMIISGKPGMTSWSRLCFFIAIGLVLLSLGFMNTPQRINWCAAQFPSFSFLADSKSMMVEYGYLYDDPDTGIFRSRFSREQLEQIDQQRGREVAKILDRSIHDDGYSQFMSIYTVVRDAYVHEAGVHLFRRKKYFDRAQKKSEKQGEYYSIALWENRILQKYFPTALNNSRHRWSPEMESEVTDNASKYPEYESAVSEGIITRFKEGQVMSIFAFAILLMVFIGARLSGFRREN